MTKVYEFVSDAGHGWLIVPLAELSRLGIADQVTKYSYVDVDRVALEEDCDYGLFETAMRRVGEAFNIRTTNVDGDSNIRRWQRYVPRPNKPASRPTLDARQLLRNIAASCTDLRAYADNGGDGEHAFNLHADTEKLTRARDLLGELLAAMDEETAS